MDWINGGQRLERDECLALLATARVGRVGLSVRALPMVLPVNFALDGDTIVFRTHPGTDLDAAVAGEVICFETDMVDVDGGDSWSVTVLGYAEIVEADPAELAHLGLPRWSSPSRWIRLATDVVSGMRLSNSSVENFA